MIETTDVLIVGAGPAGLATAIGLAQAGVEFRIVDALPAAQNTSRAAVIHAATLETLGRLKVAEQLISQGIKTPDFRVRQRDRVLLEARFSVLDSATPYALMIPQDETEAVLTTRLAQLGHQVSRAAQVVEFARQQDRVVARISSASGDQSIAARFIIGADGEKSLVRTSAGIGFPGKTYGSFLLADVHMDWPIAVSEVSLFFAQGGTLVVAPMSRSRFRVVAQLADAPAQPSTADVQRLIDLRGPSRGVKVHDVIWGSRFQVHHKIADRFRDGPFLLVGDAAHVHSPAGGQGMNLGVRDAEALASALTDFLRHGGTQLDEYAAARRASAQQVLDRTDRLTRLATLKSQAPRWLRDRVLTLVGRSPVVRKRIAQMLAGFA
ncbi:FAD-dependent monooxygenase [Devosia submarina]|uniref:FAD-dependent monooxygenase n=1 Tax=Devosia submarina TaxID=1173082 RepID=UPI000D3C0C3A|nr:FAD-dependent monooxygenase [Devosia submarina]